MLLDELAFPNRSVLDDALRRCRIALVEHVRRRLTDAYPDDAADRLVAELRDWPSNKKHAAATQRSGVVPHLFDDEFAYLEISHVNILLTNHSRELLQLDDVPLKLRMLLDEVSELRNANAHNPPLDVSTDDCSLGLVRISRLLREFGLEASANEIAALKPTAGSTRWDPPGADIDSWSEFGRLLAGEIDLLDDRVWPRHETTVLAEGVQFCPYVKRSIDDELRRRCEAAASDTLRSWEDRVIVVVGESKSGKTRSLVEQVKKSGIAERKLVWLVKPSKARPTPLSDVAAIVRQTPDVGRRLLVVVDDLQFHLGAQPESIGYHDIRLLAQSGTVIAITTHQPVLKGLASELPTVDTPGGRPTTSAGIDPRLRALLDKRKIDLQPQFESEELDLAISITGLSEPEVARLPESLVATGLINEKAAAATPLEQALLESARLLCLASPDGIAGQSIYDLTQAWASREFGWVPTHEELVQAIDWATMPVVGQISILEGHQADGHEAPDDQFRLLDQMREPVSLRDWLADLTSELGSHDRIAIARRMFAEGFDELIADLMLADVEAVAPDPSLVAYLRWSVVSNPELRSAHLRRAADGGYPDAMFGLARQLADEGGDIEAVRYWYDSAVSAGVADAGIELAKFYFARSRDADGVAILQREAEHGNALAYMPLADELTRSGDQNAALRWFRLAREVGDPQFGDRYNDARLAERLGQSADAAELFRLGFAQGDRWCAFGLAQILLAEGAGLTDKSRELLTIAADDGHPIAGIVLAIEEFELQPSRKTAQALVDQVESAEESECFEKFICSTRSIRALEQMVDRGWGELGLRLLHVVADCPNLST